MITLPANGLLIPDLPHLLDRHRLTSLLQQRDYKLTMLVAPLGFGKTSLARQYAQWITNPPTQPGSFAWLSLDLRHIKWDVRLFLQLLVKALKNDNAGGNRLDLGQLEHDLAVLEPDIELTNDTLSSLVYSLANSLAAYKNPLLLVLDDFHVISDDRLIVEVVNTLLVTSPANFRLVITSRLFPGLDVLKLTIDDQFLLVNKNQLRFNHSEIAGLLTLRGKDSTLVEQVEKRSEGWAALVALSIRLLDNEPDLALSSGPGPLNSLFGSLVEETLRNLNGNLRQFLEDCSILDAGIDVGAAGYLLDYANGEKQATTYLNQLEKQGLAERHKLVSAEGENSPKTVFRLHNLLKEHLEGGLEAERLLDLHQRVALYYQNRGEWFLAFEHYLKANDQSQAAALLEAVVSEQFKTNNLSEIAQSIERLDAAVLSSHPHLLLVAGMTRFRAGRIEQAIADFFASNRLWGSYPALDQLVSEEVAPVLDEANNPQSLDLAVLINKAETISRIGLAWMTIGRLPKAIAALEGVVQFLNELQRVQSNRRWLHVLARTRRTLGACYLHAGRLNECIEQCNKALSGFISLGDEYQAAGCRHNLGIAWRRLGNQAQAERELRQALEYWQRVGGPHLPNTLNSLASGLNNEGRYKEAIPLIIEAQAKAREAGYEKLSQYLLTNLGDAYIGLRDWNRALPHYGQAGAEADKQNHLPMLTYAQLGIARVYRRSGDINLSWKALLKALSYAENSRESEQAAVAVEMGAYRVMSSQFEMAQAQLNGAMALARKVAERQIEATAYFWLACMYFKQSNPRQAQENMRRALTLSQELGYDAFLLEEAHELPELSAFFRGRSSEQTLAFFNKEGEEVLPAPALEMRAFGKGQLALAGREVRMSSKKARELIFFLLEEKSPVSGERLSATLWPDGDLLGNGLGSGFYSTITHARRALGGAETVRASGGCYSLNLRYRYDVEQFEQNLNRAERQFDPMARIALLNEALEYYSEDFLSGGDLEWMQLRRESLRQKRLRALRGLADAYAAANQLEAALEAWLKTMAAEPFDEQPVRAYVSLLAQVKSKTIAVNFLRRKIEALQAEGIQPEDQTLQLLQSLDASRTISKRRS